VSPLLNPLNRSGPSSRRHSEAQCPTVTAAVVGGPWPSSKVSYGCVNRPPWGLSLQRAEGRRGLCIVTGHAGELCGASDFGLAESASIMWPPMRAGAPRSSVGPRGCSDSRVRSPEAVGGDGRDVVGGGDGKVAAEGGEGVHGRRRPSLA